MAGGCIMDEVLPVSVTVLLPTRNEEEALGATVDAIPEIGANHSRL